jgi:hypothetical protein
MGVFGNTFGNTLGGQGLLNQALTIFPTTFNIVEYETMVGTITEPTSSQYYLTAPQFECSSNITIVPNAVGANPVTYYYIVYELRTGRSKVSNEIAVITGDATTQLIFSGTPNLSGGYPLIFRGLVPGTHNELFAGYIPNMGLPTNLLIDGFSVDVGGAVLAEIDAIFIEVNNVIQLECSSDITIIPNAVGTNPITHYYIVYEYKIGIERRSKVSNEIAVITGDATTQLIFSGTPNISGAGAIIFRGLVSGTYNEIHNGGYPSVLDMSSPTNLLIDGFSVDVGGEELAYVNAFFIKENILDDSNLFSVGENSGIINFYTAPNFDTPLDINTNNIYEIGVTAIKGAQTVTATISITVTNYISPYTPATIINQSPYLFQGAHGICQHNDKFYIGTMTSPATLTCFKNPNDLSDYDSFTVTGRNHIESMVYDDVNNRIYATSWNNDAKLCILSINPLNITDYTIVYNSTDVNSGVSPTICTDGVYVYGGTYQTNGVIFKIRISDWTLITTVPTAMGGYHSSSLYKYSGRNEFYMTATVGYLVKVNCLDLTYSSIELVGLSGITDDIYFKYVDDNGGLLYCSSESMNKVICIDTNLMTYVVYDALRSFGLFSDGIDLYSCGANVIEESATITKYPLFNLSNPIINLLVNERSNEMFISSTGKLFFTSYNDTGELKEFVINE